MVQWVKNLPAVQGMPEIRVGFLSQEDPLEEGMQPTLVFLPGESHGHKAWQARYSPWGRKELDMTEVT